MVFIRFQKSIIWKLLIRMIWYFSRTNVKQWNFVWQRKKIVPKSADRWRCQSSHCLKVCRLLIRCSRIADITQSYCSIKITRSLPESFIMTLTIWRIALCSWSSFIRTVSAYLELLGSLRHKGEDIIRKLSYKIRCKTTNGLRKRISEFEETCSFDVKRGRGRKPFSAVSV